MLTADYKRLLSALFLTNVFTLQRQIQRKASQNGITEIHRRHTDGKEKKEMKDLLLIME